MSTALKRFYRDDEAVLKRETEIFDSCTDKVGKMLRWTQDSETGELRNMAMTQGGLYNGKKIHYIMSRATKAR